MSGIILLLILSAWFYATKKLSGFCVSKLKLPEGNKKQIVQIVCFVLIFIMPVADDIAGGFQFRALCTPENILIYDENKLKGKLVIYRDVPLNFNWPTATQKIKSKHQGIPTYTLNKIIPIVVTTGQWEDFETGELLITYKRLRAKGGWLSRFIGFPQGSPPYTFDGSCSLKEYYQLFKKLNVTKIKN